MKFTIEEQKVLEQFRRAYRERENRRVGDRWHQDAMGGIRSLGSMQPRKTFLIGFEYLVWRMVPAFCLILIVLSALVYELGLYPDIGPLQILMNIENDEATLSYFAGL
ncbi:MAG: hypothetical protein C4530_11985 [Desulfobacteraceae bacterium]|nr:MAG: hypothetical protein C4530_11985 [Desulfobacteraceae bacterium]